MLERRRQSTGAASFVVRDEHGQVIAGAEVVPPRGDRRARIDWAPNPEVTSLSDVTAGQLQDGLGELRENMSQLDAAFFADR